jgi:hypothetical protein
MRKRYVYRPSHPQASEFGFVDAALLGLEAEVLALNAPVLMDRFYENTQATDGTDIGSRRKHREYMKRTGLAPSSDFSPGYYENVKKSDIRDDSKARRDAVARATYEVLDRRR